MGTDVGIETLDADIIAALLEDKESEKRQKQDGSAQTAHAHVFGVMFFWIRKKTWQNIYLQHGSKKHRHTWRYHDNVLKDDQQSMYNPRMLMNKVMNTKNTQYISL